jgi:hypothetical protein
VVVCLSDRDAALRLGVHFRQRAIFDLAIGRNVLIGSLGLAPSDAGGRV